MIDARSGLPAEHWPPLARLALRATLIYFVLVWAPLTIYTTFGVGWWNPVATAVGRWGIVTVLGLPPRSAPTAQIATLLAPIVASVVFAIVSVVGAVIWSMADRRTTACPRLLAWLHTGVRFLVGATLIGYGASKILPGQFGLGVLPDTLVRPFGTLQPQELLWGFMAASRPYTIFTGVVELAAGLLLLSRRTATAGALVAIVATSQVLVLNVAYDVIVKLFAAQLLLMALFVAAPDVPALARLLLSRQPAVPRRMSPLFARPALDRAARLAGAALAIGWTLWAFNNAVAYAGRREANRAAPLYGIWERQTQDDAWQYLVVPWNGMVVLVSADGVERFTSKVDVQAGRLALTTWPPGKPQTRTFSMAQPDSASLVLREEGGPDTVLRRVDESTFPLNGHQQRWVW